MNWHSLLSAAIIVGLVVLYGLSLAARIAAYKRTGSLKDFLKIFSRY